MLNLKRNILLNILISASIPVLAAIFFFISEDIDTKKELIERQYALAVEAAASDLQNYITRQVGAITMLAGTPTVKSMNPHDIRIYLTDELARSRGSFQNFIISLNEAGDGHFYSVKHGNSARGGLVTVDDSSPHAEAVSLRNKPFWQSLVIESKNRRSFFVSYPESFFMEHDDFLVLSSSIIDENGETAGVLSGIIGSDLFAEQIKQSLAPVYSLEQDTSIILTDISGNVLFDNGKPLSTERIGSRNPEFAELMPRMFKERKGIIRTNDSAIVYEKLKIANIVIAAALPETNLGNSLIEAAPDFVIPIATVVLLCFLISIFTHKRIKEKLKKLAASVEAAGFVTNEAELKEIEKEPELTELTAAIRKITKAAKESAKLSQVITDGVHGIEYWIDGKGRMRFISPTCHELTGYTSTEFEKESELLDRLFIEHDKEKWLTQKHGADKDTPPCRLRIKTKDGITLWVESLVRSVIDGNGRYDGIRGSLRDIDRLVSAENMFNENEQLFRKVFVKNTAVMMLIDPISGAIYDVNRAAETFYQSSRDSLINTSIMSFIHDRDKNMSFTLERLLHSDIVTQILPDGSLKETEIHSTLLKFKDQVQLFLIIYDITNKVELQKKIAESEQLFRTLAEKVPVGIMVFSDKIHYANPMACEISGFLQRELESGNLWEHVAAEQQNIVKNSYFSAMENKGSTKKLQDIRLNRKDGGMKNVYMTISSIIYEGKAAGLATLTDISEIKEVQYQLERKIAAEIEKHRQQEIMLMSQSRLASMGKCSVL